MNQQCQLWMGSLESYMTESFLMTAFVKMGESPTAIKIMRNRLTGEQAGYCFVHFPSDEIARTVMHKLNGKVIPNSSPPVRFKLNHAGPNNRPVVGQDKEYSLWVGDLSPDIDDYTLYKCFASRYQSIRTAKVVLDSAGFSKGYAFIRFASEEEQKNCCVQMNGFKGLGSRPIKVSGAVPKTPWKNKEVSSTTTTTTTTATTAAAAVAAVAAETTTPTYDYTAAQSYYDATAWQTYSWPQSYYETQDHTALAHTEYMGESLNDLELIGKSNYHYTPLDVDELNQEAINKDYDLWDAIENSKWTPVDIML
ncbi:hypothetical protein RUM44_011460 [Polyplax serrata]|uniref:tRNA selenocysteine-associated protein 1 n=1 Tax=Polyplax serrata TaxID=468196 RepID=A0ABR1AQ77_POLSC